MLTLWIQSALGDFMSKAIAPAAVHAASRVVPAEYMPAVCEVVEKLFNPAAVRVVGS
ncbi:hypothetical protein ACFSBG_10370 [Georgenia yuyongxinii]|uniref:hypothetical protein n=1 Tax=Georgenia yuyongxinii TaxID=2589797 RepID=UPI00143DCF28|nr:hypothetical protein [Georgenia yuyongxinii]